MSVPASVRPTMMDDSEDDDMPIVFKRNNTAAKQNSQNSELKKPPSQKPDGQLGKQASEVRSSNGQNSKTQKDKPVIPTKASQDKSPIVSPKSSNSSAKSPPTGNPKASTSNVDQLKRPPPQNPTPPTKEKQLNNSAAKSPPSGNIKASSSGAHHVRKSPPPPRPAPTTGADQVKKSPPPLKPTPPIKEGKQANNSAPKMQVDSEDSEDDKPLSTRITAGSSKVASNQANKVVNNSGQNARMKTEGSDDEAPLSSKLQTKPHGIDEKKPMTSKVQQNGAAAKVGKVEKSPATVNKRPLGDAKESSQTLVKKPKLADGSSTSSAKQVPAKPKSEVEEEDDDHVPISERMKKAATSASKSPPKQKATKIASKTPFKKSSKTAKKVDKKTNFSKSSKMLPGSGEGQKWVTLVHNGVIFPPPYTPHGVKMLYKGKPVDLTPEQEEVATMYAVMLETEYMTKPKFKENFMADWRKILGKNHVIQKLEDCDFTPIYEYAQREKEKKKQMTTEEKKALKEEKLKLEEKYMWAMVDGVKEKVGNFRVEPPGLFRGRGEHPKMGKLKKRIKPSDITINIGKDAPIPECPIPGQSWKEVRHDNTVTWLAYWNDPINPKEFKYVFLAASSSLKGQSDKEKYEKARMLKNYIQGIRSAYTRDFTNKDMTKRQIAVATYLIDKLALRAGNEKDDDEADTVGCCTLKVENVEPLPPNTLKFDFLGKDSIRYQNEVEVEPPVFKAIQQFRLKKDGSENLFDQLDTSKLNAHLKELMPGLTAKVFRTYNASITLDDMLSKGTKGGDVAEKVVVYQHANKEVAIICNHQRTVSKSHSAQMTRLDEKIGELKGILEELKTDLARAKKGKPPVKSSDGKNKRNLAPDALQKKIDQTNAKIEKMERDKETKEDLKTVALGTSKINYLDPRITVAWCKRYEVPIEKMFNKSLLAKFAWAMDVEPEFRF